MQFSPQQDAALVAVDRWLHAGEKPVFYLAGYAGTGKTTIARHLAEQQNGLTQFCAFTGKAALVMKRAGCDNARTIHSLIYDSKQKSGAKLKGHEDELAKLIIKPEPTRTDHDRARIEVLRVLIKKEREKVIQPAFALKEDSDLNMASLIVADECSMIDETMARHLMSFDIPILVLGDPAQLPPVNGSGYFTQQEPDFTLTEIHRQATDNPIIAMATRIRNGDTLPLGTYGDSKVITKEGSTIDDWLGSDMMLCGKNKTRTMLNAKARKRKGIETLMPVTGDRLICLHNDHEVGLLNGSLWECEDAVVENADRVLLSINSLDNLGRLAVEAHTAPFQHREIDWRDRMDAQEFYYAYAITVHKSQGSQWDAVTVLQETWPNNDLRRWLYTAVTRAAERVTLIRG